MRKTKIKINKPIYLGFSILEISKTLMYESWCDYMKLKQTYVIWTPIVLLLLLKPKTFMKILQMMLKKNWTHQMMNEIPLNATDHCL